MHRAMEPDGTLLERMPLPATYVTSLCFDPSNGTRRYRHDRGSQ